MDRYESLILEIIHNYKLSNPERKKIRLRKLEKLFWEEVEANSELSISQGRIGERITKLYINGLIENKDGYGLTRKGRAQLAVMAEEE